MEVPPAWGPEIGGLERGPFPTAPLAEQEDGEGCGEEQDECTNQYLPLQPVFQSQDFFGVGVVHLDFLRASACVKRLKSIQI